MWKDTLGRTGAKSSRRKMAEDEAWCGRALCALLRSSEGDTEPLKRGVICSCQDSLAPLMVDCRGVSLKAESEQIFAI